MLFIFRMYNESLYSYLTASYLVAEIKAQFTSDPVFSVVDEMGNNDLYSFCVWARVWSVGWLEVAEHQ